MRKAASPTGSAWIRLSALCGSLLLIAACGTSGGTGAAPSEASTASARAVATLTAPLAATAAASASAPAAPTITTTASPVAAASPTLDTGAATASASATATTQPTAAPTTAGTATPAPATAAPVTPAPATAAPTTAATPAPTAAPTTAATPASTAAAAFNGTIKVTLTDSAIVLDRTSAPAGKITFSITNAGYVTHELIVLQTSVAQDQLPPSTTATKTVQTTGQVGAATNIVVGASATLTLNLTAGPYVLICNIQNHYKDGMHTGFSVTAS